MQNRSKNKIPRGELELAKALRDHLVILRDALEKLLSDYAFAKVIAATLRVLIYAKGRTNVPLLFSLADKKGDDLLVITGGPPAMRKKISLKDFFQELHFASGTEKIKMSIEEFIGFASQQEGTAHEDHSIDRSFLFSKGEGLVIGGLPPNIYALRNYGRAVYSSGLKFLKRYYPEIAKTI